MKKANEFQRKRLRLEEYDYSQNGYYFVTLCTKNKESLFGEIINNESSLNEAGQMIEKWWIKLEDKFNLRLDKYIIMPNHFHGIIQLKTNSCADSISEEDDICIEKAGRHPGLPLPSLSKIMQWFKTMTTNEYIRKVREDDWQPFNKKLWQRSFYDRVIRSEDELNQTRKYIINNPRKWELK
ncbi:transposase [Natroniella sulfidigena]|uniref:transposase n=1 Tax=Natroniella sulfidigena TaxID=723921 RepID=UPI00200AA1EA|nr:transposase [Natroniella sulfidigena]MCK8816335.1 transposase [Natroniella sulfidigena]